MSKADEIIETIRALNFKYRMIESNLAREASIARTFFDCNKIPELVKLDKQIKSLFRELEMLEDFK